MKSLNQKGRVTILLILFVLVCLLFIISTSFGFWAFSQRGTYKNHSDQLVASAVNKAKQDQLAIDSKQFAEEAKQPLTVYHGPSTLGSISLSYPKTWSMYVDASGNSGNAMDIFASPNQVPSVSVQSNVFALRVSVVSQTYDQVVQNLNNNLTQKLITVSPYSLKKLPNVVGVKVVGQVLQNKNGEMIILPLRSQTIEIWTEAQQFVADFENNILPNFSFQP